jgi:hypothetical protein
LLWLRCRKKAYFSVSSISNALCECHCFLILVDYDTLKSGI